MDDHAKAVSNFKLNSLKFVRENDNVRTFKLLEIIDTESDQIITEATHL